MKRTREFVLGEEVAANREHWQRFGSAGWSQRPWETNRIDCVNVKLRQN